MSEFFGRLETELRAAAERPPGRSVPVPAIVVACVLALAVAPLVVALGSGDSGGGADLSVERGTASEPPPQRRDRRAGHEQLGVGRPRAVHPVRRARGGVARPGRPGAQRVLRAQQRGEPLRRSTSAPAILQPGNSFLYDAFPVTSLLNEPVCMVVRTDPGCLGGEPLDLRPGLRSASGIAANYAGNSGEAFGADALVSVPLPAAGSREVVVTNGPGFAACDGYRVQLGADAPFAIARPAVSGAPAEGVTVAASAGAWSGTPAFGFAWLRCDAAGAACAPIPGAAGASYTPAAADAGSRLRVRVTATQGRSVSSDSGLSEIVAAAPPPPPPPRFACSARLASRDLRRAVKRGRVPIRVTCSRQAPPRSS